MDHHDPVTVVEPDPGRARTLDDLVESLRSLKVWAGDPSYEMIKDRVNAAWTAAGRPASELTRKTTVADCFRSGRRRLNTDLVLAVVQALHPDPGYLTQWRQALRVVTREIRTAAQARVQDALPPDLPEFTGRDAELDRLRQALSGETAVISAIEGMAGIGKTQLAVRAGHALRRDQLVDRVLFVDLRGFHPDPGQPPADPAAVLDGFLGLLGVPAQAIPHDLDGRTALYRARLAGTRTLVILDNAADAAQIRPLLTETDGCPVLVTSRRSLTGLDVAVRCAVDVFTAKEALEFLTRAAAQVSIGDDPNAADRIAERCGHLPLALGLIAGHMRTKPDWTLSDHADRLDERHRIRRLETGVEFALELSYAHLPADRQRLLRLLSLHPGQEADAYAAAALAGTDAATAGAHLHDLRADHLLQAGGPGRYTFHDLIRAYATVRAHDEDPPPARRAALTRLFDHYLATAAAAMSTLHPAEAHLRPAVPPAATPAPDLTDPGAALAWLDTELPNLVTVAAQGWPEHTTRLSRTLFRYLDGGHFIEALQVHGHARHAARELDDPAVAAHNLVDLGMAHLRLNHFPQATEHFRQAVDRFAAAGDAFGQARARNSLGAAAQLSGRFPAAADHFAEALVRYREAGDRIGQARALGNLGEVESQMGRLDAAAGHLAESLALFREAGDRTGAAVTLNSLGDLEVRTDRLEPAREHLQEALTLYRRLGNRHGEAWTLDSLGTLETRLGRPQRATEHHRQALVVFRETGDRQGEGWALNGLGDAARAAGRPADAVPHHTAALTIATEIDAREVLALAHTGLGHAYREIGEAGRARSHYEQALPLHVDLDMPEADEIRARLAALD